MTPARSRTSRHALSGLLRSSLVIAIVVAGVSVIATKPAAAIVPEGCTYNGQFYSAGSRICVDNFTYVCQDGGWSALGGDWPFCF